MTEPVAAPAGPLPAPPLLRFDDVHDAAGAARPHWRRLEQELLSADRVTLLRAQEHVRRLRRNQGTLPEAARRPAGGRVPHAALRALDPIPHLLNAPEWALLEAGLRQRARLLDLVLADVYGPRRLVGTGVLPGEIVYAYPGFLRPCADLPVPRRLVTGAVDLARAPDGAWRVRGDRVSVPRGLGGMLSARRVLARLHPDLYRALQVQRVDGFYDTLRSTLAGLGEGLAGRSAEGDGESSTRTVILSPGPDAAAFPEHTYLARNLGYTLVSGTDLTVRHGQVTVRSVGGLEPADVVLRLVDDAWCDPLELRPDSLLGPPGLIEATRRGRVALANALGTGFLEHPGLAAFLPAVSRALLGEDLLLAPVPAWWCGDEAGRAEVLADLDRVIFRALTPDAGLGTVPGARLFPPMLTSAERDALRAAVEARPGSWAAEEWSEAGAAPVVHDGRVTAGRLVLRCFVVAKGRGGTPAPPGGDDWEVLPGGLARVRFERPPGTDGPGGALVVRKDVWALAVTPHRLAGPVLAQPQIDLGASLPSRNAEALYWMGRHAEAAETAIRVVQTISAELGETPELATDAGGSWVAMFSASLRWTFEPPRTPGEFPAHRARRATALGDGTQQPAILRRVLVDDSIPRSLVGSLAELLEASLSARELVSTHTGQVLAMLEDRLEALRSATPAETEEIAGTTLINLMALVGLSAESMVRDPGYLMSDIGRRLERARLLVRILMETLVPVPGADIAGLTHETLLACCESLVAYRRRYRSDIEVEALSSLLITDSSNPRSLAFQADRLMADLRRLPGAPPEGALRPLGSVVERLLVADLGRLLTPSRGRRAGLRAWLRDIGDDLERVGEAVSLTYFAHVPVQPVDTFLSGTPRTPGLSGTPRTPGFSGTPRTPGFGRAEK